MPVRRSTSRSTYFHSSLSRTAATSHPLGVPQKISPTGNVAPTGNEFWFGNNLDTFEINSGSPVFDRETGVVEGIQIRGAGVPHFVAGNDVTGACVRENVCSTTSGCGGYFGKAFRIERISDFIPLTPAQISVASHFEMSS